MCGYCFKIKYIHTLYPLFQDFRIWQTDLNLDDNALKLYKFLADTHKHLVYLLAKLGLKRRTDLQHENLVDFQLPGDAPPRLFI